MSFVATCSPSLRTVTLSATSTISSSLWLMNNIPIPFCDSFLMASRRFFASASASTAVGSSNTRIFIPVLSISRAISINCMWPTGRPATGRNSSMFISRVSRAFLASSFMALKSRDSSLLPSTALTGFFLVISLLSLMFSVMVNPGISINS
ncbi:hypothetical protein SDC9_136034 [bioreactor metagenome]|uniref:Uncharacterized protein n=1 Tax=bioreactor metagenome TaxID=1076179 RepID=A0A645DHG7_9ZZZZ